MALDVLQRFLTARMFDVAGEDARAAKLRDAANDLAAVLKAAPERTATFTMVAIDARTGVDEPLVAEVMKVLEKRWQSYSGAFSDEKLPTVARAIILQALASRMSSDAVAASVSFTARNMLPHLGSQADRALWNDMLGEAERRLDVKAQTEWALPSAARAEEVELRLDALPPLTPPQAPAEWLGTRMAAAAGPSVQSGESLKAPVNSQWPNTGPSWSYGFAPIAAGAVSGAINSVLKALVEAINEQRGAQALVDAITAYVVAANAALSRTAVGLERRTTLLWWKEALYSPAARVSYRGLDPAVAAALVAIDASVQTGPFAPRMAEALIRETVRSIDVEAMVEPKPLSELCDAVVTAPAALNGVIRDGFAHVHVEDGRAPLAGLLRREQRVDDAVLESRLGLTGATLISPMDLSVWLFRDLQCAAVTPPAVKRKRGAREG